LLTPQLFAHTPRLYHIVIDPGHGGKDPGATNNAFKIQEKDYALRISRRLKNLLEERGFKVSMTRYSDEYIGLRERSQRANRMGADLFISVHLMNFLNSFGRLNDTKGTSMTGESPLEKEVIDYRDKILFYLKMGSNPMHLNAAGDDYLTFINNRWASHYIQKHDMIKRIEELITSASQSPENRL